jgi:predicted metal-dependent enzyme (double-stranded beta helix superfamily)
MAAGRQSAAAGVENGADMAKRSPESIDSRRREILAAGMALSGQVMLPSFSDAKPRPEPVVKGAGMDIDNFVQDCIDANTEDDAQAAVLEVLARAVSDPRQMLAAVGEPSRAGISVIYRAETLTIFNAAWTPQMNLMPHNHLMWANIGIYTGREDNLFWHKSDRRIEAFGAKALFAGDAAALPVDVIHSVTNPLLRFTGGIHIYGGDFFDTTRSQWDPETLDEEPSDGDVIKDMFERENKRLGI